MEKMTKIDNKEDAEILSEVNRDFGNEYLKEFYTILVDNVCDDSEKLFEFVLEVQKAVEKNYQTFDEIDNKEDAEMWFEQSKDFYNELLSSKCDNIEVVEVVLSSLKKMQSLGVDIGDLVRFIEYD